MELITAQTLWKDYNPRNLPLNETLLKTEIFERYSVKHIYFNGEATSDGCTRIYARLYTPASIPSGASVVLMNDIESPFDPTYIDFLTDCGFTVLALDYAGKNDGNLFTIYPKSLSFANYYTSDSSYYKLPDNPKQSTQYVYACVMLRGYVYLENIDSLDSHRISFFGVRRGAFQVYKAAYVEPNASCAVALFNSSLYEGLDLKTDKALVYNTSLANNLYVPLLTVPTYIIDSSNNHENSLFNTSDLYALTSDSCRFYIAEHSDNTLNAEQRKSLLSFINEHCFSHKTLVAPPVLEAKNSERSLYYDINVSAPEEIKEISLYYSHGSVSGAYRNWTRLNLEKITATEYICQADVYLLKDETSAFVTVKYADGFAVSSEIVTKIPLMLGVAAKEIIKSRLVYEADMGTDDWLVTNLTDGDCNITIKEGGNGISGVTCSVNSLTTFKIGDVKTSGNRDSLLQLLVYTKSIQFLTVNVTCLTEEGYTEYSALVKPDSYGEWTKITLSADELKSLSGSMRGWDSAVSITVNSESELLINSLLWI